MARLAHQQIKQVLGVDDAPEPYYAHFQNWTKDPWGAGWHAWTAGHNDDVLIPQILQPLAGETIYVCGETWSNVQGWVQGALNTSEVMLQNKLGLTFPAWLTLVPKVPSALIADVTSARLGAMLARSTPCNRHRTRRRILIG